MNGSRSASFPKCRRNYWPGTYVAMLISILLGYGGEMMMVLVTYDVQTDSKEGKRRLRRVARACEDWGQRVQYSVFECDLNPAQWTALRARLAGLIDPQTDSLRFYLLGAEWRRRVEHIGAKPATDMGGLLIV